MGSGSIDTFAAGFGAELDAALDSGVEIPLLLPAFEPANPFSSPSRDGDEDDEDDDDEDDEDDNGADNDNKRDEDGHFAAKSVDQDDERSASPVGQQVDPTIEPISPFNDSKVESADQHEHIAISPIVQLETTPEESARHSRDTSGGTDKTYFTTPPAHPLSSMQGPLEESLREYMEPPTTLPKKLDAQARHRRILELEPDKGYPSRWDQQRPTSKHHPLWKLAAQISYGIHILQVQSAKSNHEVVKTLQVHVDEVDSFVEDTLADFELATKDIDGRLQALMLPLEHSRTFNRMLCDRTFRQSIVDGNEIIERIVKRTVASMRRSLQDVSQGHEATQELANFLASIAPEWTHLDMSLIAVFNAMKSNAHGWLHCFRKIQAKAEALHKLMSRLTCAVDEVAKRCGIASRRRTRTGPPAGESVQNLQASSTSSASMPLVPTTATVPTSKFRSRKQVDKPLPLTPLHTNDAILHSRDSQVEPQPQVDRSKRVGPRIISSAETIDCTRPTPQAVDSVRFRNSSKEPDNSHKTMSQPNTQTSWQTSPKPVRSLSHQTGVEKLGRRHPFGQSDKPDVAHTTSLLDPMTSRSEPLPGTSNSTPALSPSACESSDTHYEPFRTPLVQIQPTATALTGLGITSSTPTIAPQPDTAASPTVAPPTVASQPESAVPPTVLPQPESPAPPYDAPQPDTAAPSTVAPSTAASPAATPPTTAASPTAPTTAARRNHPHKTIPPRLVLHPNVPPQTVPPPNGPPPNIPLPNIPPASPPPTIPLPEIPSPLIPSQAVTTRTGVQNVPGQNIPPQTPTSSTTETVLTISPWTTTDAASTAPSTPTRRLGKFSVFPSTVDPRLVRRNEEKSPEKPSLTANDGTVISNKAVVAESDVEGKSAESSAVDSGESSSSTDAPSASTTVTTTLLIPPGVSALDSFPSGAITPCGALASHPITFPLPPSPLNAIPPMPHRLGAEQRDEDDAQHALGGRKQSLMKMKSMTSMKGMFVRKPVKKEAYLEPGDTGVEVT